jgi:hypothetical protein
MDNTDEPALAEGDLDRAMPHHHLPVHNQPLQQQDKDQYE